MKRIHQLLTFTICSSLALASMNVFAQEERTGTKLRVNEKTTPYGYNPGGFCASGAEDMMNKLQAANKEKFEQIAQYKKQIEDLKSYDNLLNDVKTIRDRYLASVESAAQNSGDNAADLSANLDNTKSIIRHGLILNALSKMDDGKTTAVSNPKSSQLAILKSSPTKVTREAFSQENKPMNQASESAKLKETVANFQSVSSRLPASDQASLKTEVKKIVNDIPADISPEALLNTLDKDSPLMTQLLSGQISKEDLVLCLSEDKTSASRAACSKILNNPEDRKLLIDTVTKENKKLTSNLKPYAQTIQLAQESNKDDLQKTLEHYDAKSNSSQAQTKQALKQVSTELAKYSSTFNDMNLAIKDVVRVDQLNDNLADKSVEEKVKESMLLKETDLNGVENIFYNKPSSEKLKALGIDITTKEGAAAAQEKQQLALDNAKKDAEIFNRDCDFSAASNKDENDKIQVCKGLVDKIGPQLKSLRNAHYDKVADLNAKVQKLASDNNFAANENLKEYVAEKYLCSCEKDKSKLKTTYEDSLVMSSNSCSTQFMTLSKIEGLSDSTSAIAQALYAHEIKMPMNKNGCNFEPEKLKTFSDTCTNNSGISEQFKDVCTSITSEYVVKVKEKENVVKQNAKWEKYNEDNYVEYDSKSASGYTAVKKKSTWRVIGEGVLPILPNALPIWFGNYQMKQNINNLTDQGLLQKQYLHNIDIYNASPWMYSYNYFGYGNPFSTLTSTGTTLSTTTTGSGFNFGL